MPECEWLEVLPAIDGMSAIIEPLPMVEEADSDDHFDDLAFTDNDACQSIKPLALSSSSSSDRVTRCTIRDLLDVIDAGLPAVAIEDGVFRIQQDAYFRPIGRDHRLSTLVKSVVDDQGANDRNRSVYDGEPLRLSRSGVDVDTLAGVDLHEGGGAAFGLYWRALIRICRRAGGLGAALFVQDMTGNYRVREAVGLLRHSAATLIFKTGDAVTSLYLAHRVAVFADGPLRVISGLDQRFNNSVRKHVGHFCFLPARSWRRTAYLLIVSHESSSNFSDIKSILCRLGLTREEG
jgi:hypothetical protein